MSRQGIRATTLLNWGLREPLRTLASWVLPSEMSKSIEVRREGKSWIFQQFIAVFRNGRAARSARVRKEKGRVPNRSQRFLIQVNYILMNLENVPKRVREVEGREGSFLRDRNHSMEMK